MHLFEARARRRVTQWQLKLATGIHQSKISLIEHGYAAPSDAEKKTIAEALGLDVAAIDWPEVLGQRASQPTSAAESVGGRPWIG